MSFINLIDMKMRDQRALALHVLYALDAFDYQVSSNFVVENIGKGFDIDIPLDSDFIKKIDSMCNQKDKIDLDLVPYLSNWKLDRVGVCTKLILRMAIWELLNIECDSAVIINEAVELAKCFAEKDAYKFVNGVLDEFCKKRTGLT